MNEENSLLTGAVRPALLRYALPIILSMVATQFYAVADTMIIGLRLDADALAAVSNASTVLMIFLFISGGMELGGGLLVAAGKPTATKHEMTELLYNLLFVDEIIALLTTAVGFVTLPALLRLINTPAEILDTAVLYGRIYLMGLPFLMPYDLSKECVMGCGDSKTPLKVIVATSVMNIVLDLVLVGPFGVAGAAAATAAAQVAGAVYMVAFLRRTQMDAAFSPRMLKARYARDIFRLSAPNSVQQASGTIITTVKQGLLGGLGVEAIAGFSCAGKLSSLLMMPVFGFVQSTVFFIAQNTAALQPGRVKEGLREGRRILLVYSLGVVAVCIGLRGPLLRLFTTDPAAASYGCTMLAFESVTYLFVAQKHLFEARLRGAQKMGLDAPDGRTIFEAAAVGDARTQAVLNHWINEIAQGLAGLVHIFNPQLILIGGGVSAQQALLIDPLAEKVRASVMPAFAEGLEVKAAALQNDAGLVGAVYYFREMHER